jgi:lysophospholipase L1-like esterase
MTTLAAGSSVTVAVRDGGTVAVATNGGMASAVVTPTEGNVHTVSFGPLAERRTLGPYKEGASIVITNSSCGAFDYDVESMFDPSSVAITGGTIAAVGAENAASAITSGVLIPTSLIGQSFLPPAGALNPATVIDNSPEAPNSTGAVVRAPVNYFFETDATKFEINYRPDGSNSDFRIFVGDPNTGRMQLASAVVVGTAFNNNLKRVLVDFGGTRTYRSIEIQGMKVPFTDGITVGPSDSVRPSATPSFSAIITGDSVTEGTGATSPTKGYADQLLKLLGIRKALISGLGGTGYNGTSTGTRKRLRYRFATDIAPYPANLLIHCNGINDGATNYAGLLADASAAFDLAQKAFPNAIQIVFPGFNPTNFMPTYIRDAIRDAAANRPNFYFCDTFAENEITGTGRVGTTTGVGNSDVFISSDGTHPLTLPHQPAQSGLIHF